MTDTTDRETVYDSEYRHQAAIRTRATEGKVLVRGADREWQQTRQGLLHYYLSRSALEDTAAKDWNVFVHEIHTHSGKHTHQGGLALYVLDGEGYTVVDGERYDWQAGDLLLLPVKPGGCEHQHFNASADKPAKWLALIYKPFHDEVGSGLEQQENAPSRTPGR